MAIKLGRWLGHWLTEGNRDPLWDHFINRPPADPKNNLTPALQGAPEGRIYPVKTEVSDPQTMSRQIKELGQWVGADPLAVAVAAGLGMLDWNGRLVTKIRSGYIHVADPILTDLPLAPDMPLPCGHTTSQA